MAEMAKTLPDSGGFLSVFTADNDMSTFGRELVSFGNAIVNFSAIVTDNIDEDGVSAAANAGKMMTELANALPESGGFASMFTADNDMSTFGRELVAFGNAIVSFSTAVTGNVNLVGVETAAKAGKSIAEMAKALPESGGFVSMFTADNDMSTFGRELKSFGTSIVSFSTTVTGNVNLVGVQTAAKAGKAIAEMASLLPNLQNVNLKTFGAQLVSFGKNVVTFSEKMEEVNSVTLSSKITQLQTAIGKLGNMKFTGLDKFTSSLANAKTNAVSSVTTMINSITTKLDGFKSVFSSRGKDLVNSFIDGLKVDGSKVSKPFETALTTAISSLKSIYYNQFKSLGSYLVDGFANGISANTYKATAKATAMAKAAYDAAKKELAVNSPSKKFMKVGGYVVEGLAKGITKNIGDGKKAAVNMSLGILQATKDELGIHSPSVVFSEKVGRYIVKGIADGIKKDMSAEEAAKQKAQNIVNAFKKELDKQELDITTNNLMFDLWKVTDGRNASTEATNNKNIETLRANISSWQNSIPLAQSEVAETIKTFGEASEEAQEAQNKVTKLLISIGEAETTIAKLEEENYEARKKKSSSYDEKISTSDKYYDLWLSKEGRFASQADINKQNIYHLNANLGLLNEKSELAYSEWQETVSKMGADSEDAQAALNKWLDVLIDINSTSKEIADLEQAILDDRKENNNMNVTISDDLYELWKVTDGKNASSTEIAAKNIEHLNVVLASTSDNVKLAGDAWAQAVATYGESSTEAKKAQDEYIQALKKEADIKNQIADSEKVLNPTIRETKSADISRRQTDMDIWELKYGDTASDRTKFRYYNKQYREDLNDKAAIAAEYLKEYFELVAKYGYWDERSRAKWDEYREADKDKEEARKKYQDYKTEYLQKEKDKLEEQYQLVSDKADLQYQIWEKTAGRDATDDEKNAKKLGFLAEQVSAQASLVEMAKKEWEEISRDSTKTQLDRDNAYKVYLQEQLSLANLQSEILDINEDNIARQKKLQERQRNAEIEYEDYIKKYAKWYEDHGMTKEELEKDARLVSGYDPANAVNTALNKTNSAMSKLSSNTQYTGILSSFADMGTSYTKAINDGIQNGADSMVDTTTTMIKTCADKIGSEKTVWTKAGSELVDGFIEGIKSKYQAAVNAATELASKTLLAVNELIDNGVDRDPTITPVLDLSDVSSGVSKMNSMLKRNTSLKLANSINRNANAIKRGDSEDNAASNTTYSFTQNNYSPKALSRVDIYRQTKNQISAMKRTVKT